MEKYNHSKIEKRWQKKWEEEKLFEVKEDSKKEKFYCLIEFPYPSGEGLHVGHPRSYTALDIVARKRRMQGQNVLYPIGWDAFGLPSENYAIKTGIHPRLTTAKNIEIFRRQLKSLGLSFDWSREVNTTDPEYFKWTQWIFLKLYEHGLAYKDKIPINWCLSCKIGLANEEVVNGRCERCGGEIEKREKEQWMLKITKYADRLIDDLKLVDYPERIKTQQINWIGRSEGATVRFAVIPAKAGIQARETRSPIGSGMTVLEVFTTRPDTLFGATFMVVAPEHELISKVKNQTLPAGRQVSNLEEVEKYIKQAKKKSDLERTDLAKEKTGVELKGIKAINPVNNEEISIWVADYVMMGYGTGAIMAVPAHDQRDWEFAKKYRLPITEVIGGGDIAKEAYIDIESGKMINSGQFNGLPVKECIKRITEWLEKNSLGKKAVNYKLRDWVFSRQRYWGEPIPLIFCENCGWVTVPEKELPVELPEVKKYELTDTGESPLSAMTDWVNTKCPKCGGEAKRETDTMPNWAGSNWYFLRYCDPKNKKALADSTKLKYWMPVDWYNGGMEHTTLHLLYSRFIYKFLWDIGAVPKECGPEPYKKRTSHGLILGEGGEKISKSRGNVINPDEVVKESGADTFRVYEMFMGPFDQPIPWDTKGVIGVRRFLERVWGLQDKLVKDSSKSKIQNPKLERLIHQTIKKVTEDIEAMKFNTAISALMILTNEMAKEKELFATCYLLLVTLLSPFAPHIAEELWQKLGHQQSIFKEKWPEHNPKLVQEKEFELIIQINGRVRDQIQVAADISEEEAKKEVLEREKVKQWLGKKKIKKIIFVPGKLVNIVV